MGARVMCARAWCTTVPQERRISSDWDNCTRDFFNYISSSDSKNNVLSLGFNTESDNGRKWQEPEIAKVSIL